MKANTANLTELLQLQGRYTIPPFQRDYEWTQEGQWELLFDDLEKTAERVANSSRGSVPSPHFLGAIVRAAELPTPGRISAFSVVDGQQRLTTIQLILRGMLDVLQDNRHLEQLRDLMENRGYAIREEEDRYKLWPRKGDREVWAQVMLENASEVEHVYAEARSYFAERTRMALARSPFDANPGLLVDALANFFRIVVIDLEPNDDPQVIFEVLNGRQTQLAATDLAKNLLFMRAEKAGEDVEKLHEKLWPFDEKWWKKELGTGHAARERRDVLLSSWLTVATAQEVQVDALYRELRRYVGATDEKTEAILSKMAEAARTFRAVYERPETLPPRIRAAFERCEKLQLTTALPLLIFIDNLPVSRLSTAQKETAIGALDSWTVRQLLTGTAKTRSYGKRLLPVLQHLKSSELTGDAFVTAVYNALRVDWPTDVEVSASFVEKRMYRDLKAVRIRMLLGAIDQQLQIDDELGEEANFDYDKLHIEHVLPQKWRESWPLESKNGASLGELIVRRDLAKHSIGNLTLVRKKLNSKLSNGPWDDKRQALDKHSQLRLNVDIVNQANWNEAQIEERGRRLAGVACRVWPRPIH